jgi:hypothetical protein
MLLARLFMVMMDKSLAWWLTKPLMAATVVLVTQL